MIKQAINPSQPEIIAKFGHKQKRKLKLVTSGSIEGAPQ